VEQKSLLFIFSSAAPERTAYSKVPSQMTAHLRTGSLLKAGEIAGFDPRTAVSQSGVATNEPPQLSNWEQWWLLQSLSSFIELKLFKETLFIHRFGA
jgi:hypothetical protein